MPAFSDESLTRIIQALASCERRNPLYHDELTQDCLAASFGYGEGIEIRLENGKYQCRQQRERSIAIDTYPDEAAAVDHFIRVCRGGLSGF